MMRGSDFESKQIDFGEYSLLLSTNRIQFFKKGFLGRYKEIASGIYFQSFRGLYHDKQEVLDELMGLADQKDIDPTLKKMYLHVYDLIFSDNFYFRLLSNDSPLKRIDLVCSDFYCNYLKDDVFLNQRREAESNKKRKEWVSRMLMKAIDEVEFSELFERKKDYSVVNVGAFYLNEILRQDIPEVTDFVFAHEKFDLCFKEMCQRNDYTFSPSNNIILTLASTPEAFNKHIDKLGPLENFRFKAYSNFEYSALDILFGVDDLILSKLDLDHFAKCKLGKYDETKMPFYIEFIWKNIFYYSNKELCVENLRNFFNFIGRFKKEVDLNIPYCSKTLLEYALEECNKDMVTLLIDNGAKSRYEGGKKCLREEVRAKTDFYGWFLDRSKEVA